MRAYEVAIVGGGPAGLSTALFLAHANPALAERIIVLEKEHYPRDKFCAGAIGARADDLLASIGVRVDVPSVAFHGISIKTEDGTVCERAHGIGRVVRRLEFDHELARTVRAKGIRIDEGAKVTRVVVESTGVALETANASVTARAIVGADGVGSVVRRALALPGSELRAQVIELDTEPVDSDCDRDVIHFDLADRDFTGYAWDFPTTVDGKTLVCRGVYHLKWDGRDHDIRAMLERRLAERGLPIGRYRLKRFAERGFELHTPYAAPRVLLVGEAAGIDGLTGEGIPQAIEYGAIAGVYLAEKIAEGDLSFRDWTFRLARSSVGRDLRLRRRFLPHYFGPHRARLERHLLMMPEFLACNLERFAGRPVSQLRWWKTTALAAMRLLFAERRGRVPLAETPPP